MNNNCYIVDAVVNFCQSKSLYLIEANEMIFNSRFSGVLSNLENIECKQVSNYNFIIITSTKISEKIFRVSLNNGCWNITD